MKKALFSSFLILSLSLPLHAQDKQNMFKPVNINATSLAIAPDARAASK